MKCEILFLPYICIFFCPITAPSLRFNTSLNHYHVVWLQSATALAPGFPSTNRNVNAFLLNKLTPLFLPSCWSHAGNRNLFFLVLGEFLLCAFTKANINRHWYDWVFLSFSLWHKGCRNPSRFCSSWLQVSLVTTLRACMKDINHAEESAQDWLVLVSPWWHLAETMD